MSLRGRFHVHLRLFENHPADFGCTLATMAKSWFTSDHYAYIIYCTCFSENNNSSLENILGTQKKTSPTWSLYQLLALFRQVSPPRIRFTMQISLVSGCTTTPIWDKKILGMINPWNSTRDGNNKIQNVWKQPKKHRVCYTFKKTQLKFKAL